MMPHRTHRRKPSLLSTRATLILLMACLVAAAAAGLLLFAGRHPAEASLGAFGAGALALKPGFRSS